MNSTVAGPRRFLIATAVSRYFRAPQWDRPALQEAREQIVDLFTSKLGYHHVSGLGLDPTREQLTQQLRAFCRSPDRRPDDLIAVYIAGHGEVLDESHEHVLLTSETDPDDIADALPTAELARKILLDTSARRVLLMLDACYSGRGGNELASAALAHMGTSWIGPESGLTIVTSAQPDEQAQTGAFPSLFTAAVDSMSTAGSAPATLALSAVVAAMNSNPGRPGFQMIGLTEAGLTGEVPPFLPNPRHDIKMNEVDLGIQQAREWQAQADRREVEYSSRLLVRAMGSPDSSGGWWFTGRHTALADISGWLSNPDPARPVLAVTGAPGSGKTAVLGLIASLASPDRRTTVPRDALGLPESAIPELNAVDMAIYAQNLTAEQVLQGIAAGARVTAVTAGELLEALADRAQPFTILIDGLDEAANPEELARYLLAPLASHGASRLRLLVGTRPHLLSSLGVRRSNSIDLDASRYADPDALAEYAARGLLETRSGSPYRLAAPDLVRAVARALAEAAGTSFLVARITSSTLAFAESAVDDPEDPAWRARLPRAAGEAMRQDLTTRLGEDAHRAQDLLRPLAFAEGQGLPWEDLWAALASALAGRPYTDEDLLWLRRNAGSYVVEATEAGRSAYRLYHQALAEHLREGVDRRAAHAGFVDALLSRIPRNDDGSRNWERAHPYVRRYLASHAASCDELDPLLLDPGFQLAAAQAELLAHLPDARSDEAVAAATAYQRAAHHLRDQPAEERASYLELSARRVHADDFADSASRLIPPGAWSAQWVNWQDETPHRILTRHAEAVAKVVCLTVGGERTCAISLSLDERLQAVDLMSRQAIVMPWTGVEGPIMELSALREYVMLGTWTEGLIAWGLSEDNPIGKRLPIDMQDARSIDLVELPAGRKVAVVAYRNAVIRAWDTDTGETVGQPITGFARESSFFWTMACITLPDNRIMVATADEDAPVRIWDVHTGQQAAPPITGHPDRVMELTCARLPDGRTVVLTGGDDSAARVWDLVTSEPVCAPLTGHSSGVGALDSMVLPGGRAIAITGAGDGTIRTWDLARGEIIGDPITGHPDSVRTIAHASLQDGRTVIVTGGNEGTVRMWDFTGNSTSGTAPIRSAGIFSLKRAQKSSGQDVIVGGLKDGSINIWDLNTGRILEEPINVQSEIIWAVSYARTPAGQDVIISASHDGTTSLWDLNTLELLGQLALPDESFTLALSATRLPDGRTVVITGGRDAFMRIWDLNTGSEITHVRTRRRRHSGKTSQLIREITSITSTHLVDGRNVVITGHGNGTVRVWDLLTGERLARPMISRDPRQPSPAEISSIACIRLPNGRLAAITGSEDTTMYTVRAWDIETGRLLARSCTRTSWVKAVCCTTLNSGRTVAITGDNVLRIWDLSFSDNDDAKTDWMPIREIDLDAPIFALAMGPENSVIAGTEQGIVRLTLE